MRLPRSIGRIRARMRSLPEHSNPSQFDRSADFEPTDDVRRIVLIASTARCGSHFLGHMLRDHGGFGAPYEYLHPDNTFYWARRFGTRDLKELFPLFLRYRTSPNGTFVVKAHWHQFEPFAGSFESISGGRCIDKTVWLYRESLFSQAISYVIAAQTGVWMSGSKPHGTASYDFDAIVEAATEIKRQNGCWNAYRNNCEREVLPLSYENLLVGDDKTQSELVRYLDLKNELVPSKRTQKQASTLNTEWKERFKAQAGSQFDWIFEPQCWAG